MSYSFFGTCFNDYQHLFKCVNSILNQTVIPKEIILVNSGDLNIKEAIIKMISNKKIKLIYIEKKLSRVKSLNIALDKSTAKYSFRFDSRSRFSGDYSENALKILNNKLCDVAVVGGVPSIFSESENIESKLCTEIMQRTYIYFFPKHRNPNYEGYCSSVYLGCFSTSLLKEIRFNEKEALISEDSLIINKFLEKGYKAYLSPNIKLGYVCRSSFLNILKLFNSYGYCRGNTILQSKKLFISKRHFYVFFFSIIIFLFLVRISFFYIFFIPLLLIILNLFCEIIYKKEQFNILIPIYGTLCQFSWIIGFLWSLKSILKRSKNNTNFIS